MWYLYMLITKVWGEVLTWHFLGIYSHRSHSICGSIYVVNTCPIPTLSCVHPCIIKVFLPPFYIWFYSCEKNTHLSPTCTICLGTAEALMHMQADTKFITVWTCSSSKFLNSKAPDVGPKAISYTASLCDMMQLAVEPTALSIMVVG